MARAEALLPALKERAKATEERRSLSDETMRDLFDAGLLRILQPAAYGGYEMDWPTHLEVGRILARSCPSTGWIVSVVGAHAAIIGRLNKQCQDDVWGTSEDMLIATGSARRDGGIRKVDGGYQLNGTWRFGSGVDHSEWVMVSGIVEDEDGMPLEVGDLTGLVRVLMPATDITIVDSWYVAGMSGTGSKDIFCDNLFVPEYRVCDARKSFQKGPAGSVVNSHYLYDVEFMPYFGNSLLGPLLGCAEGAYAEYVAATRNRKGALFGDTIAAQTPVQQRLAETAAEIRAATQMIDNANKMLHERGAAREAFEPEELLEQGLDRTFAARLLLTAVTRLVRQMGALGLFDTNAVQRHFRDISAMTTQIALNWDRHTTPYGQWQLGVPTGNERLDSKAREQPG
jgi:3-hydroxy-9,10-secoandrosta-1,3,5(10)-triene-9,17-dione monooxygenase